MKNSRSFGAFKGERRTREADYRPDIRIFKAVNGFAVISFSDSKQVVTLAERPEDVACIVANILSKEMPDGSV